MKNYINNFFKIEENNSSIKKEILGGVVTFFAMSYIMFLNPNILASTGLSKEACFTATTLIAAVGSIIMGFVGNKPLGIAPGMGLNSLIAVTICGLYGFSFAESMSITFIAAIIYIIITILGIRNKIMASIPPFLKKAIACGMGLFIAVVGLVGSGIITSSESTVITLGNLADPKILITLFGLLLIIVLTVFKVKASIIITLISTLLFAIILTVCNLDTGITFNGAISIPSAPYITAFIDGFKTFTSNQTLKIIVCIFTVLFLAIFNVAGTVSACEETLNLNDKAAKKVYIADSISVLGSSILGTSPSTTFAETMTGIEAGARTGLANIVTGLLFLASLFFSPLLSIITEQVTAPLLIMIGVAMMGETASIDFKKPAIAIPAFFTIFMMPLTYSVTDGIGFGIILYVLIQLITYRKNSEVKFKDHLNYVMILLALVFILYFVINLLKI